MNVLFVCMGNICRSPTAHGVFQHLVDQQGLSDQVLVDSAGTHAYHVGDAPDRRSAATARARGIEISGQRARQFVVGDFERFDLILCMDQDNVDHVCALTNDPGHLNKVSLFLEYHPDASCVEVPDPYYGGSAGFERVLNMIEVASEHLLNQMMQALKGEMR